MGYKALHRVTGQAIDYRGQTVVILASIALFGTVAGLALLGIETIRSAFRDDGET